MKRNFIYTASDLANMKITELPYLVKGLIPKTNLWTIAGASDCGKSSFLRQLALAIVLGEKKFLGFEIDAEYKSVIYVCTEDDDFSIAYFLNKSGIGDMEGLKNLRYIFDTSDLLKKLDAELKENPADLVIIDAMMDVYSGNMNMTNDIRNFLNGFSNLSKKYGCSFGFLHHVGKYTDKNAPSKKNLLGSQGLEAKMRLVIEFRSDVSDNSLRHLCIVKGNYLSPEEKEKSYVLQMENNMTFTYTGERKFYSTLSCPSLKSVQRKEEFNSIDERILVLNKQGLSTRQISEQLKKEGVKCGKTKVADRLKILLEDQDNCPSAENSIGNSDSGQKKNDSPDDSEMDSEIELV